jgi:hypothetical protein
MANGQRTTQYVLKLTTGIIEPPLVELIPIAGHALVMIIMFVLHAERIRILILQIQTVSLVAGHLVTRIGHTTTVAQVFLLLQEAVEIVISLHPQEVVPAAA